MPIYEYECRSCNNNFEFIVSSSSTESSPSCPRCGYAEVKKLMSSVVTRPNGIPKGSGGFASSPCNPSYGAG